MKTCANCKFLYVDHNSNGSPPGMSGYCDVSCGKGHWDGLPDDNEVEDPIECKDHEFRRSYELRRR